MKGKHSRARGAEKRSTKTWGEREQHREPARDTHWGTRRQAHARTTHPSLWALIVVAKQPAAGAFFPGRQNRADGWGDLLNQSSLRVTVRSRSALPEREGRRVPTRQLMTCLSNDHQMVIHSWEVVPIAKYYGLTASGPMVQGHCWSVVAGRSHRTVLGQ